MSNISKTKKITRQINKTFTKLTKTSRTSLRLSIALGRELNECKEVVKKSGNLWVPYAEKNFPHINKKTREGAMGISKLLDKNYPESLHLLNITTLYDLYPLCKPDGIEKFLKTNHINMEFNLSNETVKTFQTSVNKLILKSKKQKSPSTKNSVRAKKYVPWLVKLEKETKSEDFYLSPKDILKLKVWHRTISKIIAAAEEG